MNWPSLYQINSRAWLRDLGVATLDEIPDGKLDHLVARGFEWVWFLGVWQTGEAGREVSRRLFPDADPADVCGSCFAITAYECDRRLGGTPALRRLRDRLHQRGLKLMLDFVPNHTALDHPWTVEHRDYYMPGEDHDGLAFGRDPNFPGWPDTLQLNYANWDVQQAMIAEMRRIAMLCDGLRCDMAMLLLPSVFYETWKLRAAPFWPRAIAATREVRPDFLFLAEVYWDLEWTMLQEGFDFAYDKRLYDRLREASAPEIRSHLWAGLDYQGKLARFLENHDEPRAAAVFPLAQHQAAALITYTAPGMRFFHQGQLKGYREHVSVHLCRRPPESPDPALAAFYGRLVSHLPQGDWRLLECFPAWEGNPTDDNFIAYAWNDRVVVINYAPYRGQCYVRVNFWGRYRLVDILSTAVYDREGASLYVDLPEWGCNFFRVEFLG